MALAGMRDWARSIAEKAQKKLISNGRVRHRANREKELFTLRARHVKSLFADIETLTSAINKELAEQLLKTQRTLNPKNLGGIEVPDGARLAIEFLDRRLEVVVQPLTDVGGRPAPVGPLATASVIQYDRSNPSAADWFDISLRDDGTWQRKAPDGTTSAFVDKDLRVLFEWLVA